LIIGAFLTCVLGVSAELTARLAFGLGDPPLFVLDDRIEYLMKPSSTYRPFHHVYSVNSHSMRSAEFPEIKVSKEELRVLVVGDSIINGGVRVDQSELATEVLRSTLVQETNRSVIVGNASAGSWGPVNELEYLKRFGTFNADVVVLVLNSDDLEDVPGAEAIGVRWPRHRPALALFELGERAFPNVFGRLTGNATAHPPTAHGTSAEMREQTTRAVREVVALAQSRGACVAIVQYLDRSELEGQPKPGLGIFGSVARDMHVLHVTTESAFTHGTQSLSALIQPDGVHPTAAGQRLLGGVLAQVVRECLHPERDTPTDKARRINVNPLHRHDRHAHLHLRRRAQKQGF
jgi:hypothetical protein